MRNSNTLTDTQLVLLSHAAQQEDGAILPPPPSLSANEQQLKKSLQALLDRNLIEERNAKAGGAVWRSDGDHDLGLFLTDAGRAAIGLDEAEEGERAQLAPARSESASPPSVTPSSKVSAVLDLMRRDDGATLDQIVAATDWLPHSARAALTGLRKKGHAIHREKVDGVSRYRIIAAAE